MTVPQFEPFTMYKKTVVKYSNRTKPNAEHKQAKDMSDEEFEQTIDALNKQIENMQRLVEALTQKL